MPDEPDHRDTLQAIAQELKKDTAYHASWAIAQHCSKTRHAKSRAQVSKIRGITKRWRFQVGNEGAIFALALLDQKGQNKVGES